jgi:hypothetical protein
VSGEGLEFTCLESSAALVMRRNGPESAKPSGHQGHDGDAHQKKCRHADFHLSGKRVNQDLGPMPAKPYSQNSSVNNSRLHRTNRAANESDRSSTSCFNSVHDLNPYSRASTNCASCKAIASDLRDHPVKTASNL